MKIELYKNSNIINKDLDSSNLVFKSSNILVYCDDDYFESLAGKVQAPEFAYYGATRGEDSDGNLDSNYLKPKPGISGVTVNFIKFGGAVRKATVKWTCWTLDQLAMYQKGSFLSAGRNVILDWGWVRGEKGLEQVPKILVTAGKKVMLDEKLFKTELDDEKKTKKSILKA